MTEDAAKKGWKTIFRTCGRDDAQGKFAGEFLAKKFKDKKIAILHDKTAYGKGIADETKKTMNAAGLQEAMYEAYQRRRQGFLGADHEDEGGGHRRVLCRRLPPDAALIIRQAREQGLTPHCCRATPWSPTSSGRSPAPPAKAR